jgi:hypothetical protein
MGDIRVLRKSRTAFIGTGNQCQRPNLQTLDEKSENADPPNEDLRARSATDHQLPPSI